jgi:hypothetical protein
MGCHSTRLAMVGAGCNLEQIWPKDTKSLGPVNKKDHTTTTTPPRLRHRKIVITRQHWYFTTYGWYQLLGRSYAKASNTKFFTFHSIAEATGASRQSRRITKTPKHLKIRPPAPPFSRLCTSHQLSARPSFCYLMKGRFEPPLKE